ncbi:MAG TPA: carbamoyltransferase HypF [Baekduia sp.]|uniref:carbamoyltransferase HypF n=1 Tax=Baekduia sp. TaxID=2600305 RepID=UPI002D772049|nr:carbamoyltransferase HypF [Baekduia sp.]HET6505421.1 carbamoyltransferase HypF [Baekduia sp.]
MTGAVATGRRRRVRVHVEGTVQGVGFRPYVHRLAHAFALDGRVGNDARGVVLEVEGDPAAVAAFLRRLPRELPPLARVDGMHVVDVAPGGDAGFAIVASEHGARPDASVTPDAATCDACLRELRDPADRRFRHPFISCTDCGPRFTIVRGVPYDRPLTTMAGFAMCAACRAEYDDPGDRRFHAQPIACPDCGPRLALLGAAIGDARDPVRAAARLIADGAIVAVKGLGGYHLACRADDEAAVAALRARKRREDKPFALMAADVDGARALVVLDAAEEALLRGPERPIVLAARRPGARVAEAVAPWARELGVMLPYTPLHHLLLADGGGAPLVLTSGNVSDEPIAYRDADARERLAPIADAFLVHDRPIHTRVDDGVARVAAGRARLIRRSRGHVPASLALPLPGGRAGAGAGASALLACGADLKSTFCVARDGRAWVSHHLGDLGDAATRASYREGVAHFERLFAVAPRAIAHDLHPDYASTAYALARADREGLPLVGVQHHHAHLAACLAEHGVDGVAVGAIYDGSGHGDDGTVWGGELLVGDARGYVRAGHLRPVPLPGGDRAVAEPWRMACAWLRDAARPAADDDTADGAPPGLPPALVGAVDPRRWADVARLARSGLASPPTTSAGRLLDAVAALCGVRATVRYEGQAAIELEARADRAERGAYAFALGDDLVLDPRPAIRAAARELASGVAVGVVSARFHRGLAAATAAACARAARQAGTEVVVLSGGVFQNRLLLEGTHAALAARGLRVLAPERLPCNDGGIAYGQAVVAASREERS